MRIAGLMKNDLIDGMGFNVSLWAQGCPFHCEGCHNPETWNFNGGQEIELNQLIQEIIEALNANGVERNFSVLGGEPLCEENVVDVAMVIKNVRQARPNIKIFVWTGYLFEDLIKRNNILNDIDVLVDGQFKIDERDVMLWLRGSRNQRVIDVQKSLQEGKVCEYINPYN